MSGSEIAQFRERQRLEEESAFLALFGPAEVASHDAIIKRMEQGADALLPLFQQGRGDEAIRLWQEKGLEEL
jgi:hypothetical protein